MRELRAEHRTGRDHLAAVTELLRRVRRAHPTAGLFEAADLQWWWRIPRATDALPQLVWYDPDGRPAAAAVVTDWGDRTTLAPVALPDAPVDLVEQVLLRGLAHAAELGYATVEIEVDEHDAELLARLADRGFGIGDGGVVETWMTAGARPAVSPLAAGYHLTGRVAVTGRPHHMAARNGPAVETRLRQTSLYRPDLDLVVHDDRDQVAAYGLFWYDPATATGLVEPMRTEADHRRRGLARHVLASGLALLAAAGATRIKICYEPDNPPARDLYLGVGFEPVRATVVMTGPTA